MGSVKRPVQYRCCQFRECGKRFRVKRKNQRHCCPSHRVRDAVRRFYARTKRDYHVRLPRGRLGRCAFCGKPQVFVRAMDRFCPSGDCARLGAKAGPDGCELPLVAPITSSGRRKDVKCPP